MNIKLVDCTLRDGGYYNNWSFSVGLIAEYVSAMASASVDYVELGFRSFDTTGFRGACAYSTDDFIAELNIPDSLGIGVMVNAAELIKHSLGPVEAIKLLFCKASESPIDLVRLACHVHEIETILPVCDWLQKSGYKVGVNLMQVADRSIDEIEHIAKLVSHASVDVLYFADSLGSMNSEQTTSIMHALQKYWKRALGIHAHDNMGRALANSLQAINDGATWVDSTVTGMGRGPGNTQTEYLILELEKISGRTINFIPLLSLIRRHFEPMQSHYGWGKNTFYYLAGLYGIHPTFIQEMLNDPRYEETEILAVIEHLRKVGGKKYCANAMEMGRQMYGGETTGTWEPAETIKGRDVLIIGAGPGVVAHREAIQQYISRQKPYVIALNTQTSIDAHLVNVRAACHPFRLLADCEAYRSLTEPLVVPMARLNNYLCETLDTVPLLDFGFIIKPGTFEFGRTSAVAPSFLAIAYALAVSTSGKANRIYLAGFDGYGVDDPRTAEMDDLLFHYQSCELAIPLLSITPTKYNIPCTSVYAL